MEAQVAAGAAWRAHGTAISATRGDMPVVRTLAWFVDEGTGDWATFALTNTASSRLQTARGDMRTEFANPANRYR